MFAKIGFIGLLVFIILLPVIITVIVGVAFANMLGFSGLTWWAFVILFYIVMMGLMGFLNRNGG